MELQRKPPPDAWEQGDPYEQYVGRWSRRVAPGFVSWLALPKGRRWLDVGCGTGALLTAISEVCAPSELFGIDPSQGFLQAAARRLPEGVRLSGGTAEHISLQTAAVDAAVCGLVLNFVPDPAAGLAEMARVTAPGGTVAAYVWDYAGRMELMRHFWDAAAELDPRAAALDEGVRFPLCTPPRLEQLFDEGGLSEVEVTGIEIATRFSSFDDYWKPFLGGQGPAPGYAMSLGPVAREELCERLRARLPLQPDGSIALRARAWAVRGIVAD
jgi:SAM-dependent methyltransferase